MVLSGIPAGALGSPEPHHVTGWPAAGLRQPVWPVGLSFTGDLAPFLPGEWEAGVKVSQASCLSSGSTHWSLEGPCKGEASGAGSAESPLASPSARPGSAIPTTECICKTSLSLA